MRGLNIKVQNLNLLPLILCTKVLLCLLLFLNMDHQAHFSLKVFLRIPNL